MDMPLTYFPGAKRIAPLRRSRDLAHQPVLRPIVVAGNLNCQYASRSHSVEQLWIDGLMILHPLHGRVRKYNVELTSNACGLLCNACGLLSNACGLLSNACGLLSNACGPLGSSCGPFTNAPDDPAILRHGGLGRLDHVA